MKTLEQIGAGNDKDVFLDPEDPRKKIQVIFRKHLTNEQAESIIYLNKIARLFFPDNIPEVYSVENEGKSIMKVERIMHDALQVKLSKLMVGHYSTPLGAPSILSADDQKFLASLIDTRSKEPRVLDFLRAAEKKGLIFDIAGQNFSIDESSGTLKIFDVDPAWTYEDDGSVTMNFDKTKLSTAILELPENLQNQARKDLEHLVALFEKCPEHRGKKVKVKKQIIKSGAVCLH